VSVITRQDFHIVHLLEAPKAAPTLARWFVEEWAPWYGPDGAGDAGHDLAACRSRNELPVCLVALNMDDQVLGTAALKSESVGSELGVGPWLAAFLVGKEHRGKGVGTALVEAIEEEACRLGFKSIYTSTETAESIMKRRGWQAFGSAESLRGPVTTYRRKVRGSIF
jgi:GNAT superfamily N-acetyltransferase